MQVVCFVIIKRVVGCVCVCVFRGEAPKRDFLRQYICTKVTLDSLASGFCN